MDSFDLMENLWRLRQQWPQVNENTKVVAVPGKLVTYAARVGDNLEWNLETTEWRDRSGIISWFWRVVGALFNNHKWTNRGSTFHYQRTDITTETIQIKKYVEPLPGDKLLILRAGYSRMVDAIYISQYYIEHVKGEQWNH